MVAYGVIILLILQFKPSGLYGYKELTFKQIKKYIANLKTRLNRRGKSFD
jgi:ribosomal protein L29